MIVIASDTAIKSIALDDTSIVILPSVEGIQEQDKRLDDKIVAAASSEVLNRQKCEFAKVNPDPKTITLNRDMTLPTDGEMDITIVLS